jgi:hypothetical protein
MTSYRLALFLHLLGLMLAASAGATTKLAVGHRIRARTVGDALDWYRVQMRASKLFPISLAVFTITGCYMVAVAHINVWSTGFIVAGLVGVALLFASGTFLGIKGKALESVLENLAKSGGHLPAPRLAPPRAVTILPLVNEGIALSVIFDMATKPTSVTVALGVMVIGVAATLALGLRHRPAMVPTPVASASRDAVVGEPRAA